VPEHFSASGLVEIEANMPAEGYIFSMKFGFLLLLLATFLLASCWGQFCDCDPPGTTFLGYVQAADLDTTQDSLRMADLHIVGWRQGDSATIFYSFWRQPDLDSTRIRFEFHNSQQDSVQVFYKDRLAYQMEFSYQEDQGTGCCDGPRMQSQLFTVGSPNPDGQLILE
jgi:hypothetical protein